MSDAVDSTVLVGAIVESKVDHAVCLAVMRCGGLVVNTHGLSEAFSSLTGGRLKFQYPPSAAVQAIERAILPRITPVSLDHRESLCALHEAHSRGVRGGAIYDYLHLVAARIHQAPRLFTLNVRHFRAFWRPGDPDIVHPADATKLQAPEQPGAS